MLSCAKPTEDIMDPILHIPLSAIAMDALPRDRATLDAAAPDRTKPQTAVAATKSP